MRASMTLAILWTAAACRPDPGDPSYPERNIWEDTANPRLEGFTPYDPAVPRLSLGVFYEGESSEQRLVDGVTNHLYIYSSTFSQAPVTEGQIEGSMADLATVGTVGWWGGGVHWDVPGDVSAYRALHLALKGADPSFDNLEVGVVANDVEVRLRVVDYGFASDGEWHSVSLPLDDLAAAGADLTQIGVALLFIGTGENPGAEILVDDVYYTGAQP